MDGGVHRRAAGHRVYFAFTIKRAFTLENIMGLGAYTTVLPAACPGAHRHGHQLVLPSLVLLPAAPQASA
jgi:hypothetical protein